MPVSTTKQQWKTLMVSHSVVIMVLIENSPTMEKIWNQVRYEHLVPLEVLLKASNKGPSASVC